MTVSSSISSWALAVGVFATSLTAQGVPVFDRQQFAERQRQLLQLGIDAEIQDDKGLERSALSALYQDQIDAFTRVLEQTTGITDISGFENGGSTLPAAADTYPVVENNPHAERLFGDANDVERMIITVARRYEGHPGVAAAGLNPLTWRILFQSLIKQESRFNNAAVSPVGARGFAQLMPGTAADLGVDPRDPWQNLDGGARYILAQLERFRRIDHALAAYNAGPGRVIQYGGVPPFEETRTYIARINRYYAEYLGTITGVDMTGSLAGFDGASATWGNWSDASIGYGSALAAQVEAAMTRTAAILTDGRPQSVKEAVDLNTYMLAERARLLALTLRLRAAHVKVEAAEGLTTASLHLEMSSFWRYARETD